MKVAKYKKVTLNVTEASPLLSLFGYFDGHGVGCQNTIASRITNLFSCMSIERNEWVFPWNLTLKHYKNSK